MRAHTLKQSALFIISVFFTVNVAHAGSALTMESVTGVPGNEIMIPVTLQADTEISALSADIVFDADKLEFVDAGIGAAAGKKKVVSNALAENKIRIGIFSLDNKNINSGIVLQLTFFVKPTAPQGVTEILQYTSGSSPEGEEISIEGKPGNIKIGY